MKTSKQSSNKTLKPLSNFDLDYYLDSVNNYRGTFMSDTLPKKIKSDESCVINLDIDKNNGTHWVCVYNSPKNKHIYYIDPFGLPPSKRIHNYLKTSKKECLYNNQQLQYINSVLCGYYCVMFILELSKGEDIYDILSKFKFNPIENEKIITKYFML
jgi:hypothetical protein